MFITFTSKLKNNFLWGVSCWMNGRSSPWITFSQVWECTFVLVERHKEGTVVSAVGWVETLWEQSLGWALWAVPCSESAPSIPVHSIPGHSQHSCNLPKVAHKSCQSSLLLPGFPWLWDSPLTLGPNAQAQEVPLPQLPQWQSIYTVNRILNIAHTSWWHYQLNLISSA